MNGCSDRRLHYHRVSLDASHGPGGAGPAWRHDRLVSRNHDLPYLCDGSPEFGIIQSDVAFAAYTGKGAWADKPFTELRSVFGLYSELVTIIARGGAGIREIADLAGKRINVGKEGSGTGATWEIIEAALGWDEAHRARVTQLPADATTHARCMGEIDANLLIVGHPSEQVRNQLLACDANLVAITGPIVDKLLNTSPYYHHVSIPGDSYGLPANLPSFGVARC
jgi:uncharacterized protein